MEPHTQYKCHTHSPPFSLPLPPSQIHAEARAEKRDKPKVDTSRISRQTKRGEKSKRDREGKGGPDEWNKVERVREKTDRERERDKPKLGINRLTKRGEKSKEVRAVLCMFIC